LIINVFSSVTIESKFARENTIKRNILLLVDTRKLLISSKHHKKDLKQNEIYVKSRKVFYYCVMFAA